MLSTGVGEGPAHLAVDDVEVLVGEVFQHFVDVLLIIQLLQRF